MEIQRLSTTRMMCSGETTQELRAIISCQNEKMNRLEKKLEEFDSVVSERNDLREIYKHFEQINENNDKSHKKLFSELLNTFNALTEKLKKVGEAEFQWELKYGKLEEINNCISQKIKILNCNECKLQSKLTESETALKCVQKDLCTTKLELEEQKRVFEKLNANLKCKKQELCNTHRELENFQFECKKLNETIGVLNSDLNSTKNLLCDTKSNAKRMEERCMQERETLLNELKISCNKMYDLQARYDEAICKLNDEKCNAKKLATKLIELNRVSAKNHIEMKSRLQRLQGEMCSKNNELCCLKKKVNDLQQENDCKCKEISALKNKVTERECQLKQMCLLAEKIEQIKIKVDCSCCPKPRPCCPKPNPCCPKPNPCCPKPNPCCPKPNPCCPAPIPCCPKTNPGCPKPNACCLKPNPCCPKPNPCSPKKKIDCCKRSVSLTDLCGGASNSTKAIIQKYATKCCPTNTDDVFKTELKSLKCELEDLQQSVGCVS